MYQVKVSVLQKKLFSLLFFLLFALANTAYALPFLVVTKAGTRLPTEIFPGTTVTAYYTVSNNTLENRNNNFVKYLPPGVTQVTAGGTFPDTCGAFFNLSARGRPGDSCTLQLTISAPVNANDPNPHNHLFVCFPGGITCAGTTDPLNVRVGQGVVSIVISPTFYNLALRKTLQYTAIATFADGSTQDITSIATWNSSNPAIATITSGGLAAKMTTPLKATFVTGGLATGKSPGTTNITATFGSVVSNVAILNVNAYVYITSTANDTLIYCRINIDGSLSNCISTGISPALTPTVSPNANFLYVTTLTDVLQCPINNDGSLGSCITTGGFNQPHTVAFNSSGTFAYVTNFGNNQVSLCNLNPDQSLGACSLLANLFSLPTGITLDPTNTVAYVSNASSSEVSTCPINPNGTFAVCTTTSGFAGPVGLAVNAANTFLYVTNNEDTFVTFCSINPGGSLNVCSPTGTFMNTRGVALNTSNTIAYITDGGADTVYACQILGNGSLGTCTPNTNPLIDNPFGINILQ